MFSPASIPLDYEAMMTQISATLEKWMSKVVDLVGSVHKNSPSAPSKSQKPPGSVASLRERCLFPPGDPNIRWPVHLVASGGLGGPSSRGLGGKEVP